jgi:flagellar M-ring protein FliF
VQNMFSVLVAQLREFFKSLTPIKRMSVIASVAVAFAAIITVALMAAKKDYVVLIKDVAPDQAAAVLNVLETKKIPYQLVESGRTILVPHSFLPSTQMMIMSEVGSESLSQGLELFDKQSFGTTTYEQKIKYQRAIQGELMRSINTIESISRSKVILAIPEKKVFANEGADPTASVVVELHPGKTLGEDQVRGITYLVANSVENLRAENVSVVDSRGKVLSKKSDGNMNDSAELMDARKKIENYFQERIESILAKVVGEGRVIARVNADLNHKQISSVAETVDPDRTAIKSSQTTQDSVEGNRSNPTGVAGARANLPGASEAGNVTFNQDVKKEQKIVSYEVPKTITNVVEAAGSINRLSIAVLVDGVIVGGGGEGKEAGKWQPRSVEEVARLESIVKNAIGFDDRRGDSVKIESFQFAKEDFSSVDEISSELYRQKMIRFVLSWVIAILGLILVYLFVIRPFTGWLTDSFQESIDDMLPKTIEELEELQSVDTRLPGMNSVIPVLDSPIDPEKAESEILKERILGMVQEDEEKASGAFSLWLIRRDI